MFNEATFNSYGNSQTADPVLRLIAEAERLAALADALREREENIFFAVPGDIWRDPNVYVHTETSYQKVHAYSDDDIDDWGRLYGAVWAAAKRAALAEERARIDAAREASGCAELARRAAPIEAEREAVFDQIVRTKATTIAGIIAQIEVLLVDPAEHIEIVLAGLRGIQRRLEPSEASEVASRAEPSEPAVIGFGELDETAPETLVGAADGTHFLAAEKEIAAADRLAESAADDDELQPIFARYDAAIDFVALIPPRDLVGAVVKLRRLLADNSPLVGFDREMESTRQTVTYLEREIAGPVAWVNSGRDE